MVARSALLEHHALSEWPHQGPQCSSIEIRVPQQLSWTIGLSNKDVDESSQTQLRVSAASLGAVPDRDVLS